MKSRILNYVDFERVNFLLESFNQSTGFVTAILDLDGNILSKSGWRQICVDFHRKNPMSVANCVTSDTILANKMSEGERYHFYQCKNGLIDVAVPIIVKGEHIANLFSGQFFFEQPDVAFFRKQAKVYGFDEESYISALGKVPVVSREEVRVIMDFLLSITLMITDMTSEKLELTELNDSLKQSESNLLDSQVQLKQSMDDLLESQCIAHIGTWRLDLATDQVVWSEELYRIYGFDPTVPPPPYTEHMKLFTPDSWERLSMALAQTRTSGIPYELELETVLADGSNGWMWVRAETVTDANGKIVSLRGAAQDITERKRIELQLRESEERFQMLFDKAPLGYQSLDAQGYFIEINQKWLDLFGYQKEEVIGRWFGDFLAPQYKDAFRKRFPIFKAQGYIHSEFEMVGKTGNHMFIAFDGKIGYARNGAFQQTHCILQDITVERELEKELAENRKLMKSIIENTTDAIYVKDLEGKYVLVNHAVEQVSGKTKLDLIGKDDYNLFASTEAAAIMEADQVVIRGGETKTFEEIATDASGRINYYSSTKGPIYDEKQNISGLFGIARNITVQKELEEKIEQEKKLFEATLISVGDGVISTDIDGNIKFMNPVAERLTGWQQADARGRKIEEIFDIRNEQTEDKCESIAKMVFQSGNIVGLANHTILVSKDGEKRPIEDCASPIKMESGELIGVVIVFSDFSEKRKRMEEIEFLSYHDYLTGLYNRRFFEEELKRHDVARNLPISIVMGDVNGLKLVNDSFGHATGDEILRKAAELVMKACRTNDVVSRLGGDEFVVLLPRADEADSEHLIKRIQDELADVKIAGIPLSVSFGFAIKQKSEERIQDILRNAEDNMYRHKLYESTGARSKTVNLIINTLYEKNHREMHHSQRVGMLSATIATAMGLSADDVNQIRTAGLMHDIGKIGVEDQILNKVGRLNAQEWEEIKKHSEIGYRILSSVPEFSEIADFVLEHQERWDGKGYPRGLKGVEISLEARIIAVADSFDAMTGERTYGRIFSEEEAMQELLRCAGTQFDPTIVEAFANRLKRFNRGEHK